MSTENLEQFMSKVADSEELQAKIGEEIEVGELMALGAECGYDFNCHEVREYAEREDMERVGIYVRFLLQISDIESKYKSLLL